MSDETPQESLGHYPDEHSGSWVFDASVAACFDDMLVRSVPLYRQAQELVGHVVSDMGLTEDSVLVDVGVSTAQTFRMLDAMGVPGVHVGIDPSDDMLTKAKENHPDAFYLRCSAEEALVKGGKLDDIKITTVDVAFLMLVLQFMPRDHRRPVLEAIYNRMPQGGAIFLFEKCAGVDQDEADFYRLVYHTYKHRNGYTWDEIMAKERALMHVLRPTIPHDYEGMMRAVGFRPTRLLSWCQFNLWVAFKD